MHLERLNDFTIVASAYQRILMAHERVVNRLLIILTTLTITRKNSIHFIHTIG